MRQIIKNRIRIASLLICLALFAGSIAGCGKGKINDSQQVMDTGAVEEPVSEVVSTVDEIVDSTETIADTQTGIAETGPKHVDFSWDPYRYCDFFADLLGEETRTMYHDFVDAILNQKESISCSDEFAWNIYAIVKTCIPVAEEHIGFDYSDGKMVFIYDLTQEEQDKLFANFGNQVESIVEACVYEGDSDVQAAAELFQYYSSIISYNYDAVDDVDGVYNVSPYTGIMSLTGICQTFAGAYSHLCVQCGIPAGTSSGLSSDMSVSHEWSTIKLNGVLYYVDPTFAEGGYSFKYFGFTDKYREEVDGYPTSLQNVGDVNLYFASEMPVGDDRFEELRSIVFDAGFLHEDGKVYAIGQDENYRKIKIELQ